MDGEKTGPEAGGRGEGGAPGPVRAVQLLRVTLS